MPDVPERPAEPTGFRADLSKRADEVGRMFDQVAPRYDLTNSALTLGNDALWRARTTRAVDPQPGERILDLGAGTGSSSASLARRGASVLAADISAGMLDEARRRHGRMPNLTFTTADANSLPFDDDSFDAVTMSYALRNVTDPHRALRELYRVTKPGGRMVINEFSRPTAAPIRAFSSFYNGRVLPQVARLVGSNPDAYDYLHESIATWPDQQTLAAWMRRAGWSRVEWRNMSFGMVALHRAFKARPQPMS